MALGKQPRRGIQSLRSGLKQVGPLRLLATLLFLVAGLYLARFSWDVPVASDAERTLYDLRFDARATRTLQQDDRIVLVTFNDDTLAMLGKRSPLDRAMLADALRAIDSLEPRAIGIDILIDQAQPEDEALIETFRSLKTPTWLAFASARHNPDQILPWQEAFLSDFLGKVGDGPVRPASIRLQPDLADGVIRRWPTHPPELPPLLATAIAPVSPTFRSYSRSIDFVMPGTAETDEVPVFTNLPIQFVAEFPEGVRPMIQGRYVLIGGDIQDLDDYETPMTRQSGDLMKGLEVHAQMLAQALDRRIPSQIPNWVLWISALVVVAFGALTALEQRGWRLALLLVVQAGLLLFLPVHFQGIGVDTVALPAFGWGAGWLLAFIGVGIAARAVGSEQRRFAQSALGKYLPEDIANEILEDPDKLALRGEKKRIFALFTDLEGFTKLSHAITPEQLSDLLNRYLDAMSETVLKHGGTIDKFVGDAVVAFWGAPIARADDADRAVRAAVDLYETGERFASAPGDGIPPLGRTRVGLHFGEAVVGNFGGKGRIQYTALGDGMNTAARLESANKALKTRVLVSTQAKEQATADVFRPMGRIVLSGRATPIEVWEPVPDMDPDLRRRLMELWLMFDGGSETALEELVELSAEQSEDAALRLFVSRLREAGPGGHFVLASK